MKSRQGKTENEYKGMVYNDSQFEVMRKFEGWCVPGHAGKYLAPGSLSLRIR